MVLHSRHRLGSAHAGDDIFALGVDQKLAIKDFLTCGGIAGERHA